ncbi:MAG: tetratricopeptide repeat protein [Labilithrix sp.]|nr:tetratricopeptide repeat protein [Labilithrix sp.]
MHDYFLGDAPSFGLALVPYCFLSMILFTRHPRTNFIFDEQEALLANPFVRSIADAEPKFRWIDAFYRDFWGLGPERSIGSYRPIPNLVWRALWGLGARDQTPFLHHWVNVLLHGVNGALMCVLAFALTKRRGVAWIAGAAFTASALLTEAVSGVVGIADVLGATGTLLALLALTWKLPWMALGVILGSLFGLYSKESALCCVPLLPLGALLLAPNTHPEKPRRWLRAVVAFVAAGAAFVLYVEARRRMFPAPLPPELSAEANAHKGLGGRAFAAVLRWYAQPTLPRDPLNNPLVHADALHRVGGALRVWWRGLMQVVFPYTLSGDYSAPQEPVPETMASPEIILGGLAMVLPFPLATWLGIRSWRRQRKRRAAELQRAAAARALTAWVEGAVPAEAVGVEGAAPAEAAGVEGAAPAEAVGVEGAAPAEAPRVEGRLAEVDPAHAAESRIPPDTSLVVAFGALWVVLSFFPVSNLPVLLPTVRAERFWYFPVIGTSLILAVVFGRLAERVARTGGRVARRALVVGTVGFFLFQAVAARRHANDYTDDLSFWDATRKAVPRSAKAHLNYSVMKGARGDLEARLAANGRALELAPKWPMASIYYGDTLCRLHRAPEAWPHYVRGFELAPNDVNLVALGVQCLWDEKLLVEGSSVRAELDAMKDKHPGSWLEYVARDVLEHGEEHNGVDPKYRPRGYNEGPKD